MCPYVVEGWRPCTKNSTTRSCGSSAPCAGSAPRRTSTSTPSTCECSTLPASRSRSPTSYGDRSSRARSGLSWGPAWSTSWFHLTGTCRRYSRGRRGRAARRPRVHRRGPGFQAEGLAYDATGRILKGDRAAHRLRAGATATRSTSTSRRPRTRRSWSRRLRRRPRSATCSPRRRSPLYQLAQAELVAVEEEVLALGHDIEVLLGHVRTSAARGRPAPGPGDDGAAGHGRPPRRQRHRRPARAPPAPARRRTRGAGERQRAPRLGRRPRAHRLGVAVAACGRRSASAPAPSPTSSRSPRSTTTCGSPARRRSSTPGCRSTSPISSSASGPRRRGRALRAGRRHVGGVRHQPPGRRGDGPPARPRHAVLPRGARRPRPRRCGCRTRSATPGRCRRSSAARRQAVVPQPEDVVELHRRLPAPHVLVGGHRRHAGLHALPADRHLQRRGDAGRAGARRVGLPGRRDRRARSMLLFGYGDGGGGPTREMVERAHRFADLEGMPQVRLESPGGVLRGRRGGVRRRAGVVRGDVPRVPPRRLHLADRDEAGQPPHRAPAARGRAVVDARDAAAPARTTPTTSSSGSGAGRCCCSSTTSCRAARSRGCTGRRASGTPSWPARWRR